MHGSYRDIYVINSILKKHKYHQIPQRCVVSSRKWLCGKSIISTVLNILT